MLAVTYDEVWVEFVDVDIVQDACKTSSYD